jgi:hypothetical protein
VCVLILIIVLTAKLCLWDDRRLRLLYLCKSHVVDVDAGATLVEVGATLVEAVVSQPESACTQQAGSTLVKPSLTPTGKKPTGRKFTNLGSF